MLAGMLSERQRRSSDLRAGGRYDSACAVEGTGDVLAPPVVDLVKLPAESYT